MYATPPPFAQQYKDHQFITNKLPNAYGTMIFWTAECSCGWQWTYNNKGVMELNGNISAGNSLEEHANHLASL